MRPQPWRSGHEGRETGGPRAEGPGVRSLSSSDEAQLSRAAGSEDRYAGAMSTETFIEEFLASVKMTPRTGGTSP